MKLFFIEGERAVGKTTLINELSGLKRTGIAQTTTTRTLEELTEKLIRERLVVIEGGEQLSTIGMQAFLATESSRKSLEDCCLIVTYQSIPEELRDLSGITYVRMTAGKRIIPCELLAGEETEEGSPMTAKEAHLMTAEEARNWTKDKWVTAYVLEEIERTARSGVSYVYVEIGLPEVAEKLRSLGYEVEHREDNDYLISW